MLLQPGMLIDVHGRLSLCVRKCLRNEARTIINAPPLRLSYPGSEAYVMLVLRPDGEGGCFYSYELIDAAVSGAKVLVL